MIDKSFGCVNNTIRTRSGIYFDLANPKPEQITIEDIAGALSKVCRFGGQCEKFYSVAEHSYHCSKIAKASPLALLLHDAAEAYTGDIVKPLKNMLPEFSVIESRIEAVIAAKFGVDFEQPEVKEIDMAMLIAERRSLFSADAVKWTGEDNVRRLDVWFSVWEPKQAEKMFLNQFQQLTGGVQPCK